MSLLTAAAVGFLSRHFGPVQQSAVDGTNNSQAFFSETKGRTTVPYVYSMDSIQEFQVSFEQLQRGAGPGGGRRRECGDQVGRRTPFTAICSIICVIPR